MNLEKHRSAAQRRLPPINSKRQVPEDCIMLERRFIPPRRIWIDGLSPRQEFVPNWLILTSQIHYAVSTSQSHKPPRIKLFPRYRTRNPTCESDYFFSLGSSYLLPKTLYDSYACRQNKIHIFGKLQTCLPWWPCPLPVIQTECKQNKAVVFCPDTKTKS
jgi:hypothetical protein